MGNWRMRLLQHYAHVALSEYSKSIEETQFCIHVLGLLAFMLCGLQKEGLEALAESFKISEKISDPISRACCRLCVLFCQGHLLEDYSRGKLFSGLPLESMQGFGAERKIKFFMSSLISGALREFKQGLKAAIVQSLKGAECAEETDSYLAQSSTYEILLRQYAAAWGHGTGRKILQETGKRYSKQVSGRSFP